jgi:hypothetical protein
MASVPSMGFFTDLDRITRSLNHLRTLLSHLPESLPLSESPDRAKYNFQYYIPDPKKVELYGTTEAALNNALEITFAPNGRKGNDAPCRFQFAEHSPGLVAVADAIETELGVTPSSAILRKWVEDLLQVAEYHYRASGIQVSMTWP